MRPCFIVHLKIKSPRAEALGRNARIKEGGKKCGHEEVYSALCDVDTIHVRPPSRDVQMSPNSPPGETDVKEIKEAELVKVVDNPYAPEFFAARLAGLFIQDGNISLTFKTPRVNHETTPGPINEVISLRLVMSVTGAQLLAIGLYDFLKRNGLDPVPPKDQMQ